MLAKVPQSVRQLSAKATSHTLTGNRFQLAARQQRHEMEAVPAVDPSRVRGLCQKHPRQTAATTVDWAAVKVSLQIPNNLNFNFIPKF